MKPTNKNIAKWYGLSNVTITNYTKKNAKIELKRRYQAMLKEFIAEAKEEDLIEKRNK